ncbi:hypothetical protein PsorP6_009935 [Peronosclerospora sorghi]|uniref:Uncharacterized protein n=1 Tax=Peronosclerospora sorghi TaxID=230839 RepID=A0ACC0VVN7_9STRA|nr:hypothetical protein PsorP6_009935 [Peronosclerospora sorghi]
MAAATDVAMPGFDPVASTDPALDGCSGGSVFGDANSGTKVADLVGSVADVVIVVVDEDTRSEGEGDDTVPSSPHEDVRRSTSSSQSLHGHAALLVAPTRALLLQSRFHDANTQSHSVAHPPLLHEHRSHSSLLQLPDSHDFPSLSAVLAHGHDELEPPHAQAASVEVNSAPRAQFLPQALPLSASEAIPTQLAPPFPLTGSWYSMFRFQLHDHVN